MKLPGDIAGEELAQLLRKLDYKITRQTGSHLRLTTARKGEHHITIPRHEALRLGTLNKIPADIANHLEMPKADLIEKIFKD